MRREGSFNTQYNNYSSSHVIQLQKITVSTLSNIGRPCESVAVGVCFYFENVPEIFRTKSNSNFSLGCIYVDFQQHKYTNYTKHVLYKQFAENEYIYY